jgi:anion-transporting  ArsA/GET3 family ATPase
VSPPPRGGRAGAAGNGAAAPLLQARLVLCMGSGGVGKTSTAAALACAAALAGRRCALITVDPARRLRNALGLEHLSATPTPIAIEAPGELHAMALDTKRVFDDLVDRASPSPEIAARILANPLYRELSNELGGSTEYMAMEKLHELLAQDYDVIVVDTPPSAHARDLLAAPARIAGLIDSGAAAVLRAPASILRGSRLANSTLAAVLAALERWVGKGLVRNLSDFAAAFEPLLTGFRERAGDVQRVLRDDGTAAVLITTAEPAAIAIASELCDELREHHLRVAGIIANRVHTVAPRSRGPHLRCAPALREKLETNYEDYAGRARRDRANLRGARDDIAPVLATVPRFDEPIASLPQLVEMAAILARQLG